MPLRERGHFSFMGYIRGEGRSQGTLFAAVLDDLVPGDPVCRVIDAFVKRLEMDQLGFARSEAAETGRPGYDPRDLLKLYLYGYLHPMRSSGRLEAECRRNVEVMGLLERLYPDHKSSAEFRRMHREAVTAAGVELIQFARSVGLIRGEWMAMDGSQFRAASSARSVLDREALQRYLDQMEAADAEQETTIDFSAVTSALEKLRKHPEPEARFMRTADGKIPAYHVQPAVDAEHALIVTHQVTTEGNDSSRLQPVAAAVRVVLGSGTELINNINIIADTGDSNGEQASICEATGLIPHIPAQRSVNHPGDGTLLDRTAFTYQPETDSFRCPAGQTLKRKPIYRRDHTVY